MKYVRVKFSNGETYDIPDKVIANSRGKYYADKDFGEQGIEEAPDPRWTNIYSKERKIVTGDDSELLDWANNNMNWSDVEQHAILIPSDSDIDKGKEWASDEKEKEVVEH